MRSFMKQTKRFFAVFMTVLMVMSSWVFIAPTKAEAAYASYTKAYSKEYYYASGTKFFGELAMFYKNKDSDNAAARKGLTDKGYTPIGGNFNAGDGKSSCYVWMGVKYTTDPTKAITAFNIYNGSSKPNTYTATVNGNSVTFYKVGSGAATFVPSVLDGSVDLNKGAGGADLAIYATNEYNAGAPITEYIQVQNGTGSTARNNLTNGGWTPVYNQNGAWQDCNEGMDNGSDYLYEGYKSSMTAINSDELRKAYNAAKGVYDSGKTSTDLKNALDTAVVILNDLKDGYTIYDQGTINTCTANLYVYMCAVFGDLAINNNYATNVIPAGGETWFHFKPTASYTGILFSKDAYSSTMDPVVSINTWNGVGMTEVAKNDDLKDAYDTTIKNLIGMADRQSYLSFNFVKDTDYWICWKHYNGTENGAINFRLAKAYNLVYNATGGTGAKTYLLPNGVTVNLAKSPTISRSNHTLIGWATGGGGAQAKTYGTSATFSFATATNLFALWSPTSPTVMSVNTDYNAVIDADYEVEYFQFTPSKTKKYLFYSNYSGDTFGLLMNKADWASSAKTIATSDDDGTKKATHKGLANNQFVFEETLTAGTTYLFAPKMYSTGTGTIPVRLEEIYNITYDSNGGSTAPAAQEKYYDVPVTISSNALSRSGYSFKGWSTNKTAITPEYNPGATYTANADAVLYAVWKPDMHNATFVNDDGTVLATKDTEYGVKPVTPADPSKASDSANHYAFAGWSDGTKTYTSANIPAMGLNDVTYTAVYTATAHSYVAGKCECACGYTLDHKDVTTIPQKSPNCYETGNTAYDICLYCGHNIINPVIIKMTDHKYSYTYAGNNTHSVTCDYNCSNTFPNEVCTDANKDCVCDVCGGSLEHSPETLEAVEPTCQVTGLTEGSKCSVCGKILVAQTVLEKVDHKFTTYVSNNDAACEADGTKTAVCDFGCGAVKTVKDTGSALTHTGGTANCVDKAICTLCNQPYGEIDSSNHKTVVTDEAVAATCTATGLTEGSHCDACKVTLVAQTVTEILPHPYGEYVSNGDATCTADGTKTRICAVCNKEDTVTDTGSKLPHTPAQAVQENVVEADCVNDGSYQSVVYCTECNTELSRTDEVIDALNHDFAQYVSNNDATCTVDGTKTAKCTRCDAVDTVKDEGSVLGHDYTIKADNSNVAINNDDTHTITCVRCGEAVTEGAHNWGEPVHTDATCTADGYDTYVCINCGQTKVDVNEGAKGHKEADPVQENYVAPDCTNEGSYDSVVYCSVCDVELSREGKTVKVLGHTYSDYVSNNDATCTEDGTKTAECDRCYNATNTVKDVDSALGHTEAAAVQENFVDSDCVNDGSYDMVVYCSVCDAELSRTPYTVDAKGHKEAEAVQENFVDSDCVNDGSYDMVVYCSVCDAELSRTPYTVDAKGHKEAEAVQENFVDSDCVNDGSYDMVVYCSVCNAELDRTAYTIDAKGHVNADVVKENIVEPTCTEKGKHDNVVYCSVCNEELSRVTVNDKALGHNNDDGHQENLIPATCTTKGSYDYVEYCTRCKIELERVEGVVIKAPGHKIVSEIENEVEPTCTTKGSYDTVAKCSVCDEEIARTTSYIREKGHVKMPAVKMNEVAPTCNKAGSYDSVVYCSVCEEIVSQKTVEVPRLGHDALEPVKENIKGLTCTTPGSYDLVTYCETCGDEISRRTIESSATGHTPGTPVIRNRVEPTCTEKGSYETITYCTVCKAEVNRVKTSIKPLGHEMAENMVDSTCVTEGYSTAVCTTCGITVNYTIPKKAHTDEDNDIHCDTCGTDLTKKCNHFCHQPDAFTGINGIFHRILRFFWKLFNVNKYCECGAAHY